MEIISYGAVLLISASFLLVLAVYPGRGDKALLAAFFVVLCALQATSLSNIVLDTLPGAQWDASTFHRSASLMAETGNWPEPSVGTGIYQLVLTGLYSIFGAQKLTGQSLSVIVAIMALMTISVTLPVIGASDRRLQSILVLAVGLFPTFLYHGPLTFREPYQLLGLSVGVCCTLKAIRERRLEWLAPALGGFLFMGFFHHVLLGAGFALVCIGGMFVLLSGQWSRRCSLILALIGATTIGGYFVVRNAFVTPENDYLTEVSKQGGLIEAVVAYRNAIEKREPRTSYEIAIDPDDGPAVVLGFLRSYVNYIARPLATDIERPADIVPFLSSSLRLLMLLVLAVVALRGRLANPGLLFCMSAYLLITILWSVGTTNYGQAFRHHALTDWLLLLMVLRVWDDYQGNRAT